MADNYIEKQQEQYEARKAAWKQAQKYGRKRKVTAPQAKTGQAGKTTSEPGDPEKKSLALPLSDQLRPEE